MTAPLTPPHQPSPHNDPWQKPPAGPRFHEPETRDAADLKRDARDAILVVVALTVLGIALGLLWLWLAPRVPLISSDKAVFLKDTEGEEAVGADGTFALLALGFGAVSAAAVFFFRRRGGIALVVALALGGLFVTQFFFTNETVRLVYGFVYILLALVVFVRDTPRLGAFGRAVRQTLKDPGGGDDKGRVSDDEHPP